MHLKHVFQLQLYGSEPGPDCVLERSIREEFLKVSEKFLNVGYERGRTVMYHRKQGAYRLHQGEAKGGGSWSKHSTSERVDKVVNRPLFL